MAPPLILACGALVTELRAVLAAGGLTNAVEVSYLPANLHNRPGQIVPSLRRLLAEVDADGDRRVLIGYADCGTGGELDALLAERPNLQRLPGSHCYEFFAGSDLFLALHEAELGTLYLTDFLAKHFDALVWQGLGLDRHPELSDVYFANYTRVLLLSQTEDPAVIAAARDAAQCLRLHFEHIHVGLQTFTDAVDVAVDLSSRRGA